MFCEKELFHKLQLNMVLLYDMPLTALGPSAAILITSVVVHVVISRRKSQSNETSLVRSNSCPVNVVDAGPLGMGIIPSMREIAKGVFLERYLAKMYATELAQKPLVAWGAVAHASEDPRLNSMNIAMPEMSAEYWTTMVSGDQAPIFRLVFPPWAVYCDLTAYDTSGLPVASVNARQAQSGGDPRVVALDDGRLSVNLLLGAAWSGPVCVLFRIYRPPHVALCPSGELPDARLVPKAALRDAQGSIAREARTYGAPARWGSLASLTAVFFNTGGEDAVGYQPEDLFHDEPKWLPKATAEEVRLLEQLMSILRTFHLSSTSISLIYRPSLRGAASVETLAASLRARSRP